MQTIRNRAWVGTWCIAVCLGVAGCASGSTQSQSPGPGGSSPSCTAPSTGTVRISVADNGKSFCVAPGTEVDVYLQGTADRKWTPIEVSGNSLDPAPNGRGTLAIGVTGGFFRAASRGIVYLTSQRPACGGIPTNTSASAGGASCGAIAAFRVSVQVS